MAKVDYSRDYYADLDLTQSASLEDIKAQYHKLAKLYHPDRNHGHETEFNSRFQAISAAYEVLKDPEQRQKYDANRRRGNVNNNFTRPPPPRKANPYQATSNFPPPPRRANPRPPESPPAPRQQGATAAAAAGGGGGGGGGGAARYARNAGWTGAPPPPRERPTTGPQDVNERRNNFDAWQQMKNVQNKQGPANHAQPPRRPVPTPPETPNAPPHSRPTSMPRGFSSTSPPKSAFETVHSPNTGAHRSGNPSISPNAPRRPRFDPSIPLGDEGPARAGPALYSSAPRYPPAPPPPAPSPPPRNAPPTAKRFDAGPPPRSYSGDDVSYPDGVQRTKTTYPSNVGDKTYYNPETLPRSNSFRDATKLRPHADQEQQQRRRSTSPPSRRRMENASDEPKPRPVSMANDNSERYYSAEESDGEGDVQPQGPRSEPSSAKPRTFSGHSALSDSSTGGQPYTQQPAWSSSFTSPVENGTFTRTSTQTEQGEQMQREDEFSPTNPAGLAPGIHRAESHPNMHTVRSPNQEPGRPQVPPARTGGNSFPAEQWSKSVQEENWASQWAQPGQTSPIKGASNAKRPRGLSSRTTTNTSTGIPVTPQAASVEEEENGDPDAFTGGERTASPDSGNAMDIDDEEAGIPLGRRPSIVIDPPVAGSTSREGFLDSRVYNGQNHGPANGVFERRPSLPENLPVFPHNTTRPVSQPPSLAPQLSLDSFRHVQPFNVGESRGLDSMDTLASNLPFKSQASTLSPSDTDATGSRAALPKVPKTPLLPQQRLTENNWAFYLEQMYIYLAKWNKFNIDMVTYFQTRANALTAFETCPAGTGLSLADGGTGVVHGWLGAVGETKDQKGWNTYKAGVEEDQRWRVHWQIGCERHLKALEEHDKLRRRVLSGGLQS